MQNTVVLLKPMMVSTPNGLRYHGDLKEINGQVVLWREINYFKDRMRIFDAFSVHPDALAVLTKMNADRIILHDKADKKYYLIGVKALNDMLVGLREDGEGRKLAWKAKFAGGDTIYIKLEAFKIVEDKPAEPKPEEPKNAS